MGVVIFLVVFAALAIIACLLVTNSIMKGDQTVVTKRYRVRGSDTYTIHFERQAGGTYRIRCTEHPTNRYSSDATKCHLYNSGNVCVTAGKEPRSLDRAVAVAQVWMNGYSSYVRTGKFPNGKSRVNV